jgi:hypothetical protein
LRPDDTHPILVRKLLGFRFFLLLLKDVVEIDVQPGSPSSLEPCNQPINLIKVTISPFIDRNGSLLSSESCSAELGRRLTRQNVRWIIASLKENVNILL